MLSSPASSVYVETARAGVERLPTISITPPSASASCAISARGRCAIPRPESSGLALATWSLWTGGRSEEQTSELQSLMRISYAVFCLIKKNTQTQHSLTHLTPNLHYSESNHN